MEKKQQRITKPSFTLHCSPQNFLHVLASLCSVSGLTSGPHRHPSRVFLSFLFRLLCFFAWCFVELSVLLVLPHVVLLLGGLLAVAVWDCASPLWVSPGVLQNTL